MMKPFRFWVQTVLPLVYDDSLSYYELLNKVIKYINGFIKQENQFAEVIEEYTAKVEEIEAYVNGYFDSTDFKETVEEALDKMAEDGELDDIIRPVLDALATDVEQRVSDVEEEVGGYSEQIEEAVTAAGNAETAVGELKDRVDDLEAQIGGSGMLWKLVAVGGTFEEGNTTGNRLGNCLFLCHNDEAIVFDAGNQISANLLTAALTRKGVTKIKGIVVSHWHSDHVNGLMNFINNANFDFTGCVLVTPHKNINWSLFIGWSDTSYFVSRENDAITAIENKQGIVLQPAYDGFTTTIAGLTFVFNNLDASKFSHYYNVFWDENDDDSGQTIYNNFSMITSVVIGNNKIVFPGDIHAEAESYNRTVPVGARVYVINHHGLNRRCDNRYASAISADISILPNYGTNTDRVINLKFPIVNRCCGTGSVIRTQDGDVEVSISSYGVDYAGDKTPIEDNYHGAISLGNDILNGSDFDDYKTPGMYSIQNNARLNTMSHAPQARAGGKLLVMVSSATGAINQYFLANRVTPVICTRCYTFDEVSQTWGWRAWRYLYPSTYQYYGTPRGSNIGIDYYLTADENGIPYASLNTAGERSRVAVQNGVLSGSFFLTAGENGIPANKEVLDIPMNLSPGYYTPFLMSDASGNGYLFYAGVVSNGNFEIWPVQAVAARTILYGSFATYMYTDYPQT